MSAFGRKQTFKLTVERLGWRLWAEKPRSNQVRRNEVSSRMIQAVLLSGILLAAWATPSLAQRIAEQDSDGWSIRLTPYLWGVSLDGTSAISVLPPLDIDASFSDILSNANYALQLHAEFEKGPWTFVIDPTVMSLEVDISNEVPPVSGDIDIDMWFVEAWAGYQFAPSWELLAGVRWQSQEIAPGVTLGPVPLSIPKVDVDWTDVFFGARFWKNLGSRWILTARMDMLALGDSDSSWNVSAFLNRRFGRNMALNLGYRYYTVEYQEGRGLSLYDWDMDMSGPVVGYTWEF